MRRKARIDRDSEDWNQSTTSFLVCSSTLFCFHFGVCSSLLSLFLKCLKDYEISRFIEMNCDKLHIDLF